MDYRSIINYQLLVDVINLMILVQYYEQRRSAQGLHLLALVLSKTILHLTTLPVVCVKEIKITKCAMVQKIAPYNRLSCSSINDLCTYYLDLWKRHHFVRQNTFIL